MSNILLSIWFGILRIILTFLHLLYSGLQYFDLAWALFKRKLEDIGQCQSSDTEMYVSRFVTKLEKYPSHLAVIMGTETITMEDFSNIVIWCLAAGISFVSFYDHTGFLKENENIYYKYLLNKRKIDTKCLLLNTSSYSNGIQKNGCSPKLHVNMLSMDDGKSMYVKLVKQLGKKALNDEMNSSDVEIKLINEELHNMTGYPDPEMSIICGDICSTYGFLPWQIRVTEFIRVKSLHGVTPTRFTDILQQYSHSQQRFGK